MKIPQNDMWHVRRRC